MSKITFNMDMLDRERLDQLDAYIDQTTDPQGHIILILHKAQTLFGYLPRELQLHVAHKVNLPTSRINGIVSFYSFFIEEPNGRYNISVCMGTACFVKGALDVLNEFRDQLDLKKEQAMTTDQLFSINEVRCIGACGLAPVVRVNEKIYGHVKKEDVAGIIEHFRDLNQEENA